MSDVKTTIDAYLEGLTQTDAARRHGSLVEELSGIRLYLAGKEIGTHTAHLEKSARARVDLAREHDRRRGRAADHRGVRALERDRLERGVQPP